MLTLDSWRGDSSATVELTVLDDSDDEGGETLTAAAVERPRGQTDGGEATETFENGETLPRALLAHFRRTAAVYVGEHVEKRL